MDQKKQRLAALACFVLFLAIWLLSSVFSTSSSSEWDDSGSNPVVISEILPSNRTYPDQDGQHLDFVEIHNLSADSVDISGYMLSDDLSSIGYTFPDNTVLPPHGYIACWCNPGSEDDRYANFGISREGAETIYLYNSANVVVDQKALSPMESNISLVRIDATTWEEAAFATPGFANTEEGYRQWLGTVTGGDFKATGVATADLKGQAVFTDWTAVENDYPIPSGVNIPTIDMDAYKNLTAPTPPASSESNNSSTNNSNNNSSSNNSGSNKTETKAPETDAPTTEATAEAKGGCGSSIGFAGISILALAAVAAITLSKKKGKI